MMQASSDMSVMDFQVPYSLVFTLVSAIEVIGTVSVMATVTWQVLIIAIPITFAAGHVQVSLNSCFAPPQICCFSIDPIAKINTF